MLPLLITRIHARVPKGHGGSDAWLIKLDAEGELDPRWPDQETNPRTFGGTGNDAAFSVQQTADGGYIVAGVTEWTDIPTADALLIKLDAEGELDPCWPVNPKTFGKERELEFPRSVKQTADGSYIVAGAATEFPTVFPDTRVYLIKLDTEGELDPRWPENPRTFAGEGWAGARSVEQTADGGYIVAGFNGNAGGGVGVYLIKLAPEEPIPERFLRGDCNGDGRVAGQVTDAVYLLNYNFGGGAKPPCLAACDANGDGRVKGQVTDAVYLLTFNFLAGPPPVEPFPDRGAGLLETDEALGCANPPASCQ